MKSILKGLFRGIAPLLTAAATASGGGPIAGMAVSAISKAILGKPDGTEAEIEVALKNASPADFAKIKEAEYDFKQTMAELNIDVLKIHAGDRDSARNREIQLKDKLPGRLAILILFGFFGVLAAIMFFDIPDKSRDPLNIMLGALGALVVQIGNYYYGSSKGSSDKNKMFTNVIEMIRKPADTKVA